MFDGIRSKMMETIADWSTKASKTTQVMIAGGDGAIWKNKRYDTFAKEAYLTNVVAYRCIDEIARSVESIDWKIKQWQKNGDVEDVDDHFMLDLMFQPNPEQSWGELVYRHIAFGTIAGNAYMERIGPTSGPNKGIPRELWSHRPDRMTVKANPNTGMRESYKYVGPSGREVEWKVNSMTGQADIWHMRFFNPLNDWYGAGPVEPTSREIDTSNEAMEWNKNLLQNSGRPGMLFIFDGAIGDTEYNRLEKKLKDKYGGPKNTGKHLIIEGKNAKVEPYGWSPTEMDYIEGNRELARRIALGFGVPPMLLGIPGDNTYSNYAEAKLAFWESTVFWYAKRFAGGFSSWIFDVKDRMRLVPDYDSLPALEPRRKEQFEKAEKSDFLTINEKRKMCGYEAYGEVKPDEDDESADPADKIYQNASMSPLGETQDMPSMGGFGEQGGDGFDQGATDQTQVDENGNPIEEQADDTQSK